MSGIGCPNLRAVSRSRGRRPSSWKDCDQDEVPWPLPSLGGPVTPCRDMLTSLPIPLHCHRSWCYLRLWRTGRKRPIRPHRARNFRSISVETFWIFVFCGTGLGLVISMTSARHLVTINLLALWLTRSCPTRLHGNRFSDGSPFWAYNCWARPCFHFPYRHSPYIVLWRALRSALVWSVLLGAAAGLATVLV